MTPPRSGIHAPAGTAAGKPVPGGGPWLPRWGKLSAIGLALAAAGAAQAAENAAETVLRAIPVNPVVYETAFLEAATSTDPDVQPYYFKLPAPRGQILDRNGRPLAQTKVVYRLMRAAVPQESADAFVADFEKAWPGILAACPYAVHPGEEGLRAHWRDRAQMPLAISRVRAAKEASQGGGPLPANLYWQAQYARHYPEGALACHTVGYVTETGTPLKGALLHEEFLWLDTEGRAGLEKTFDQRLRGETGLLLRQVRGTDLQTKDTVVRAAQAGTNVITTLDLNLQRIVEKALAGARKPGAAVVVSADTGDVLAMASAPSFDLNLFVGGISTQEFDGLMKGPGMPMFNRALNGEYPPGSAFKPVVALAGVQNGGIIASQALPCGPTLEIEGRTFHNWSDSDSGMLPLRGAIIRSCNTYFYQAGMNTGPQAILQVARNLGYGVAPNIPLPGASAGALPAKVLGKQAVANLSIGQGDVLATPLQVAMSMAAIANGRVLPRPRLVMQTQEQGGRVVAVSTPCREQLISYIGLDAVRNAMYGVVNHEQGTAGRARLPHVRVYGKTGTAQWMHKGKEASVVWFAGFVAESSPKLAFVVALEAEDNSGSSGGRLAAPVAGQVLGQIFAKTKTKNPSPEAVAAYVGPAPVTENDPVFYGELYPGMPGYPGFDPALTDAEPVERFLPPRTYPNPYAPPSFRRYGYGFGFRR